MLTEPNKEVLAEFQLGHANDAFGDKVLLIVTQSFDLLTHHFALVSVLTQQVIVDEES